MPERSSGFPFFLQFMVWKGPEHRLFCPRGAGVRHPPGTGSRAPQTRYFRAVYEASSGRHDQLLTHSPAFHPSLEGGTGAEMCELPIPVAVTSPWGHPEGVPKPAQSHLITTRDAPLTQEIPRPEGPRVGARVNDQPFT